MLFAEDIVECGRARLIDEFTCTVCMNGLGRLYGHSATFFFYYERFGSAEKGAIWPNFRYTYESYVAL